MKKVLASVLSLLVIVALSVSVCAAGGFVKSPSLNQAPVIESFAPGSADCVTGIMVTSYARRNMLSAPEKQTIETAYAEIKAAGDLTDLTEQLDVVVADKQLNPKHLAVSDLFSLNRVGCTDHAAHGPIQVKLSAGTTKNFVALLHKTASGWIVVGDAEVNESGILSFSMADEGPYAIVVEAGENSPSTGDNADIVLYISLMAVSAIALVIVAILLKKKKSN